MNRLELVLLKLRETWYQKKKIVNDAKPAFEETAVLKKLLLE